MHETGISTKNRFLHTYNIHNLNTLVDIVTFTRFRYLFFGLHIFTQYPKYSIPSITLLCCWHHNIQTHWNKLWSGNAIEPAYPKLFTNGSFFNTITVGLLASWWFCIALHRHLMNIELKKHPKTTRVWNCIFHHRISECDDISSTYVSRIPSGCDCHW